MKNKTLPYIYNQSHRVKIGDYLVCQNKILQNHPLHQHDFYEFEYIVEGEGIHLVNDRSYPIEKGDLLFITPMDFHGFETQNIKTITWHFFAKDMSPEIAFLLSNLKADVIKNVNEKSVNDFKYLLEIFNAKGDYAALQLKNLIELIIVDLFECKAKNVDDNVLGDGISQAIGYININFRDEITLDTISQRFHISPSYFSREFKKRTGVCFSDYLADKRFDYAKKLLKNGNRVIDACYESGFSGVRNFTRRFKALYGITPTEYTKQQNNS
ncbi:MAG: helix-turn-helix domain-containing protein [Clostridia bacterium]|nr:helix-turn-helix domain-containing protein [Clostridia bacterium]